MLRLISSKTVEELVLERAQKKLELDGKVIQAGKFDEVTTGPEYEAMLVSYRDVLCIEHVDRADHVRPKFSKATPMKTPRRPTSWTTTS